MTSFPSVDKATKHYHDRFLPNPINWWFDLGFVSLKLSWLFGLVALFTLVFVSFNLNWTIQTQSLILTLRYARSPLCSGGYGRSDWPTPHFERPR